MISKAEHERILTNLGNLRVAELEAQQHDFAVERKALMISQISLMCKYRLAENKTKKEANLKGLRMRDFWENEMEKKYRNKLDDLNNTIQMKDARILKLTEAANSGRKIIKTYQHQLAKKNSALGEAEKLISEMTGAYQDIFDGIQYDPYNRFGSEWEEPVPKKSKTEDWDGDLVGMTDSIQNQESSKNASVVDITTSKEGLNTEEEIHSHFDNEEKRLVTLQAELLEKYKTLSWSDFVEFAKKNKKPGNPTFELICISGSCKDRMKALHATGSSSKKKAWNNRKRKFNESLSGLSDEEKTVRMNGVCNKCYKDKKTESWFLEVIKQFYVD